MTNYEILTIKNIDEPLRRFVNGDWQIYLDGEWTPVNGSVSEMEAVYKKLSPWKNYYAALHRTRQADLITKTDALVFGSKSMSVAFQHIIEYYHRVSEVFGTDWRRAIGLEQNNILERLERIENLVGKIQSGQVVVSDAGTGQKLELDDFFGS